MVYGRPFASETHRMGVVASRKIGSAVVRNRFKRRMRTFFELFREKIPVPCDAVWIVTQPQAAQWSFAELQIRVCEGFEKLRRLLMEDIRKRVRSEAVSKQAGIEADAVC